MGIFPYHAAQVKIKVKEPLPTLPVGEGLVRLKEA